MQCDCTGNNTALYQPLPFLLLIIQADNQIIVVVCINIPVVLDFHLLLPELNSLN